jgi:hypothetical protein
VWLFGRTLEKEVHPDHFLCMKVKRILLQLYGSRCAKQQDQEVTNWKFVNIVIEIIRIGSYSRPKIDMRRALEKNDLFDS